MPIALAIITDSSGSMKDKLSVNGESKFKTIHSLLSGAVQKLNACNEVAVFTFGGGPPNSSTSEETPVQLVEPFTTDHQAAIASLDSVEPRGETPLYDAIHDALRTLAASGYPNRALLIVTDGIDNASKTSRDDALAQARRSGVTIYAIGIGDPNGNDVVIAYGSFTIGQSTRVDAATLGTLTEYGAGHLWIVPPLQEHSEQQLTDAFSTFGASIGYVYAIGIVVPPGGMPDFKVPSLPNAVVHAH